jgi:hypothetical protein
VAHSRIETARRLRQGVEAIFAFATLRDQTAANPAKPVTAAFAAAPRRRGQSALLTIVDGVDHRVEVARLKSIGTCFRPRRPSSTSSTIILVPPQGRAPRFRRSRSSKSRAACSMDPGADPRASVRRKSPHATVIGTSLCGMTA